MPRIVRGIGDDIVYHVINRGNGRQEVFHKGIERIRGQVLKLDICGMKNRQKRVVL